MRQTNRAKVQRKPDEELEEIARLAVREALSRFDRSQIPQGKPALMYGKEGEYRIFDLYIPGTTSLDNVQIATAYVHQIDGSVRVEVFLPSPDEKAESE